MIKAMLGLPNIEEEADIEGYKIAYDTASDAFVVIDFTQLFSHYNTSCYYGMRSSGSRIQVTYNNYFGTGTVAGRERFILFKTAELSEEDMKDLNEVYDKVLQGVKNPLHPSASTKTWLSLGNRRDMDNMKYY